MITQPDSGGGKRLSISPTCVKTQKHMTAVLFQTGTTSLWNETSIISLYFCLLFKEDFDKL